MVVKGLFRSRRRAEDEVPSFFVEGDESHAWWAERETVTTAPNPKKRGAAAREAEREEAAQKSSESGFKQYFTNESLYAHNQEPEAPATPEQEALELLGVTGEPTWKAITKAYREKAKEFHPDRQGGDDTEMVKINQAHALLRRVYGS